MLQAFYTVQLNPVISSQIWKDQNSNCKAGSWTSLLDGFVYAIQLQVCVVDDIIHAEIWCTNDLQWTVYPGQVYTTVV